jgi:formylglycine-generating enzyme required for sulfatase activity
MQPPDPTLETLAPTPFEAPRQQGLAPPRRLSPKRLAGLLAAVLIGLTAWHLFTAKAILVTFTPQAQSESVSGWLTLPLGERYLVRPGALTLQAVAEGYYPINTRLEILSAADQRFELAFEKLPGHLRLTTGAIPAEVEIDGEPYGTTPLRAADLSAGEHSVLVTAKWYVPLETMIDILGLDQTQDLALALEPAWAEVGFSSQPAGASLFVDAQDLGLLPQTARLLEGPRAITIAKLGYQSHTLDLIIQRGTSIAVPKVTLAPANGEVTIISNPAGALVSANSVYLGVTPLQHSLTPNQAYDFLISKSGFESEKRALRLAPTETITLELTLQPRLGSVELKVTPTQADIRINGVIHNSLQTTVRLPTRSQLIEVSQPGFATITQTITPDADFPQTLTVNLLTLAEAELAKVPKTLETRIGYRMRRILPATIELGAARRDRGGGSNEIQRTITLTQPYYLGATEVTNAQYQLFDASHNPGVLGRTLLTARERPVVGVSWNEAAAFCNWLSDQEGLPRAYEPVGDSYQLITPRTLGYRLPTEAEWSRAGRYADVAAGAQADITGATRFGWGDDLPPPNDFANLADDTATGFAPNIILNFNDRFRGPAPAGHFKANALGLHDLTGNVAEWMNDRFSTARTPTAATDWAGPSEGAVRVIRGSSFLSGSFKTLRWAYRDSGLDGRQDVGFRLAKNAVLSAPE